MLQAAPDGDLRVVFPMITDVSDWDDCLREVQDCRDELLEAGCETGPLTMGCVVDMPSACLLYTSRSMKSSSTASRSSRSRAPEGGSAVRSIKGIIIGFLLILLGFAVTSYSLIAGGVLAAAGLAAVVIFALPKKTQQPQAEQPPAPAPEPEDPAPELRPEADVYKRQT